MTDKPISRRLRFEILKRDGHACRYCGAQAPDATLTVDHVIPRALGGGDDPTNLVTACRDCNYGKASVHPSAETVEQVADDALRWARAMEIAAARQRAQQDEEDALAEWFRGLWDNWGVGDSAIPKPSDWTITIVRFAALGLDRADLDRFVRAAMANERVRHDAVWRYFCGICWRTLTERQEAARLIIEDGDA